MTDESAPAVRIPNVSPGAVSGLDHEALVGSPAPVSDEYADELEFLGTPALPAIPEDLHNVDDLLEWVNADPEDDAEAEPVARAIAVLRQEGRAGRVTLVGPLEDLILGAILEAWEDEPEAEREPGDREGTASVTTTGAGEAVSIEGQSVESETAGTGDAINAETGGVTPAGEPLPTVEGTGGIPLDPPQPGADADGFGGDATVPADPPAGD